MTPNRHDGIGPFCGHGADKCTQLSPNPFHPENRYFCISSALLHRDLRESGGSRLLGDGIFRNSVVRERANIDRVTPFHDCLCHCSSKTTALSSGENLGSLPNGEKTSFT
jgi:hypothetical protein